MSDHEHLDGAADADFLALGLGGTNMMSMLWTVALGHRAVGVEMRGDPFLGVHWNIRVDLYHQLGLIDRMMLERFGAEGVPQRADGTMFRLAECFYSLQTVAGDIVADEIIDGYDKHQHIVGTIHHVEFIDDRWRDGVPNRVVTILTPPQPPDEPQPEKIRTDMIEVLDGPSTFQAGAASILVLLRRYLERIERIDLESGRNPPRVRLFTRHRVVQGEEGFESLPDGRRRIRIEALQELDFRGKFVRVRAPGSEVIDLGVPQLFMVAEGFDSSDADRLGFVQEDVKVDHQDGRGEVVAQADFLAGLIEVLVGGRLRRRISSEFDKDGKEFWARQIAVGHENDPEVGWVLVQVPDFKTFDPIEAGLVPKDIDQSSPEFFAAYQHLVYDYYMEQSADILELPKKDLMKVQMVYGPKLFSLIERMGSDAMVAANGVVAGDSFGNGHFLTSGGAMTGMVGHSSRVLKYWQSRDAGVPHDQAMRALAAGIKEDTEGWLHVSAQEYSEAVPINFGQERIQQIAAASGIDAGARAHSIDATRRKRHSLLPLDPSDWRRLFLRNGKVISAPLPELHAMHPSLRAQRSVKKGAKVSVVFVAPSLAPSSIRFLQAVLGQPGVRLGLCTRDSLELLPRNVRDRIAATAPLAAVNAEQIAEAVRSMAATLGKVEMLLGISGDLQLALAEAREALGIAGMSTRVAMNFDRVRAKQLLIEAGLPVARHRIAERPEDTWAFAREVGFPLAIDGVRVKSEGQLRGLLMHLHPRPERPVLCQESTDGPALGFHVMSIGGVPAWYSAVRTADSVILPREIDDPADATVRRMGFAALRALEMGSGIAEMKWFRRRDGSAAIAEVSARPPESHIMALMGLAHGADMFRAWANAVVHGIFAPIPRLFAAGAVRTSTDLESIRREPGVAVESFGGFVLVRHAETRVVESITRRFCSDRSGR